MKKPVVCICRLRSEVNYKKPFEHLMDVWYEFLHKYVQENSHTYDFVYYNFGFNQKPIRHLAAVAAADILLIPSEAEFQYHIPGYHHTLSVKKSNEHVEAIHKILKMQPNKRILIISNDRKDDIVLYREHTFPEANNRIDFIDECDYRGSMQGMKFWMLKDKFYGNASLFGDTIPPILRLKKHDFCYWGCDKSKDVGNVPSGDERMSILKQIRANKNIDSVFIGNFRNYNKTLKPDGKWNSNMDDVFPTVASSLCTLCFNWPNFETHPTMRYAEAMGCRSIPLVWQNYDRNNDVVCDDWQRCRSVEDVQKKIMQLRYEPFFNKTYNDLLDKYYAKINVPADYYHQFAEDLNYYLEYP